MKWIIILMLAGCTSKRVVTDNTRPASVAVPKTPQVKAMNKFDSLKLINPHKQ